MTAINRKWVLGKNVEKGSEAQDQVTESAKKHKNKKPVCYKNELPISKLTLLHMEYHFYPFCM